MTDLLPNAQYELWVTATNTTGIKTIDNFATGISILGVFPTSSTVIENVVKDSPAEKAGLLPQDKIIAVNNSAVEYFPQIMDEIQKGNPVDITIARKNIINTITIKSFFFRGRDDSTSLFAIICY